MLFSQRNTSRLAFLVASLGAVHLAPAQRVIYVNASASGAKDGTSWSSAFTDLQDGLDDARNIDGCPCEIWVAAGTYKPDRGTGDRDATFQLQGGVALYGGFTGSEQCRDERDWGAHETVLSADLNNDDGPHNCEQTSTCCQEHQGAGCDNQACADEVCLDQYYSYCCDPASNKGWDGNCVSIATAGCCQLGDWHRCDNSSHILTVANTTLPGILDGFSVLDAYLRGDLGQGAGLYSENASVDIRNCVFGGSSLSGIFADYSTVSISDSSFLDNVPGVALEITRSTLDVERCDFSAERLGGVFVTAGYATTLRGCTFIGSNADIDPDVNGETIVESCLFKNGPGISLNLLGGQFSVTNSRFIGNWSHIFAATGAGIVDNCLFTGSTIGTIGGGGGSILFRNCAFLNNSPHNPAITWSWGNLYVLNCTIIGNGLGMGPDTRAGGINLDYDYTNLQVLNSIIWGNGGNYYGTVEENQISYYGGPHNTVEIDYSILQGWSGTFGGDGNFGADPMIANLKGPDGIPGTEDDNARLSPGSPAINAGLSTSQYLTPSDLDGHPRIICGAVDIGAYEFGIGDFDCNQSFDVIDLAGWSNCDTGPLFAPPNRPAYLPPCSAFDFDADGDVDLKDFYRLQQVLVTP